jgi:hypothetical protein
MAMLTVPFPPTSDAAAEESEILASAREAIGYPLPGSDDVILRGGGEYRGLNGKVSLRFSPFGAFVQTFDGRIRETLAFNGERGLCVDTNGLLRDLEMEQLEVTQAWIWIVTGHWLADTSPYRISLLPGESDDARIALGLESRSGDFEGTLLLDRSTRRPAFLRYESMEGTAQWKFDNYKGLDGFQLPRHVLYTSDWGNVVQYDFYTASRAPGGCNEPLRPWAEATFDPLAPCELEVKRTTTGHFLIHPLVNGKDVGWFLFDTCGSALIITPGAAKAAGLPVFGKAFATGVGGPSEMHFCQGESFEIGPLTVNDPLFIDIDLSFLDPYAPVPVAGLCAYPVLAHAVAEVDVNQYTLSLHESESYELKNGEWEEVFIDYGNLHVNGRFQGLGSRLFRLDTGLPFDLIIHAPTVRELGLLDARETRPSAIPGVGGSTPARMGSLDWFELGGRRIEKPSALFSQAESGSMNCRTSAGVIGLGLLEPFMMVINCPAKKIAFAERQKGT